MPQRSRAALARLSFALVVAFAAALVVAFAAAPVAAQGDATEEPEPQPSTSVPEPAPEPEAADSYQPPPGVEVMRVRGRGITGIATDVPDSVTQFDAATIQALGAQDVSDLSKVTPNVNINQPGATQATFFVRGVGLSDFNSNAQSAVTIFQDGVSLNAPAIQTGSLFDIENVNIVKGPQGTGPYRNASAGAIVVRSRRPTGNYEATLRSTIGRYDTIGSKGASDALLQDYEGALELPILEDSLSTRLAFRLREAEPYQRNGCGNAIPFSQRIARGTPRTNINDIDICGERDLNPFNGLFQNREISMVPEGLPRKVGDQHSWAARGTLRWQPRDTELDVTLSLHGSQLDQHAALGQAIGLGSVLTFPLFFGGPTTSGYWKQEQLDEFLSICQLNRNARCRNQEADQILGKRLAEGRPLDRRPYRGDYNRVGQEARDAWGGFLSAEWTWRDLDFSALGSYDGYDRSIDQDADFTPDILFEQVSSDAAWQTYEEVSVAGEFEREPFGWELGAYYLHEELSAEAATEIRLANFFFRDYQQSIDSWGIWGEFEWDFLDDFTLAGGVRYNWERKEFDYQLDQVAIGLPFPTQLDSQDETWQSPTGEIILTYHMTDDFSAYAKYSRGFKAGHYNAIASETIGDPPADPEFNDSWEGGVRGSWFDRRFTLGAAFFYYRYTDYQVFLFQDRASTPPALEIVTAEEAENYGVELETSIQPLRGWTWRWIEGLQISGFFGWLHGEYIDFASFVEPNPGVQIPINYSGNALQNSPEFTVSGTAEWVLDFGRYGYIVPRYDLIWTDDVFFDPTEGRTTIDLKCCQPAPDYAVGQKAYALHNVRLAYRTPNAKVELAAWVRNLEDTVYKTFAFDAASFQKVIINFVGEPRTYGLDLTITF